MRERGTRKRGSRFSKIKRRREGAWIICSCERERRERERERNKIHNFYIIFSNSELLKMTIFYS